jgi:hypothetical protein
MGKKLFELQVFSIVGDFDYWGIVEVRINEKIFKMDSVDVINANKAYGYRHDQVLVLNNFNMSAPYGKM